MVRAPSAPFEAPRAIRSRILGHTNTYFLASFMRARPLRKVEVMSLLMRSRSQKNDVMEEDV
eukprot:scaffold84390_cov36-Attheya_sp.AAC.2